MNISFQLFCLLFSQNVNSNDITTVANGITTYGAISLSTPEVALARSLVFAKHIRGGFGENHMHTYISQYLKDHAKSKHVPVNLGRQGIDGLYVKYLSDGTPTNLAVSEAKFGSSSLKTTNDGIQLGREWTSKRLLKISSEYKKIIGQIKNGEMTIQKMPSVGKPHRLQVNAADGKALVFWRNSSKDKWMFAGPEKLLKVAEISYSKMANLFDQAAEGYIKFDKILYRIKADGNKLIVKGYDASGIDADKKIKSLEKKFEFARKLSSSNLVANKKLIENEIIDVLTKKSGLSYTEAKRQAQMILGNCPTLEDCLYLKKQTFFKQAIKGALIVGGITSIFSIGIDMSFNWLNHAENDLAKIGSLSGLSLVGSGSGYLAGQYASKYLIQNGSLNSIISSESSVFGISSRTLIAKEAGAFLGGNVAVAFLSYGSYLLGYTDLAGANKSAIIGLAGVASGSVGSVAILSSVATFGTASTGTAIASLSGASATNATLAYLGGGSIASGGFGTAGGAVVLSGGTAVIVITGSLVAYYVIDSLDKNHKKQITISDINYVKQTKTLFSENSREEFWQIRKLNQVR